jgi:tetratricopeptide (TPR) repeat protein
VALDTLLQNGPVVLALDDLHHAPPPMVALLSYLMRTLVSRDEQPLLLLATARLDVTAPALIHVRDGSELGLPPTRISLQPLTAEHIRTLLGQMGLDMARATEQALKLAEQTGGNPFYLAEYLRARFAPGSPVEGSAEELPAGLRQLVLSRLAGLGRTERAILDLLAVAARELDLDVLLELVEEGEEEALDRLEGLRAQGLVVERRAALSTVIELAQPRMGVAIAAELAPAAAQRLHLRLADALAASQGNNPLAAEAIGAHYRLAGDPARAWRYYAKAAIGLGERNLLGEAWRLAERAAALEAEAQSRLDAETWHRLRPGLLRIRADALFNQGEWSPARDVLTLLLEASIRAGDPRQVDRAELDLATAQLRLEQREAGQARLREVLDRARLRHDWAVVIDALHRLAALAWEEGNLEVTESLATEGLMLASGSELSASRAEILLALTAVQATRGQLQAAATGLREAQGILGDLRHKRTRGLCLSNLAEVLTWQGNLGEAIQHATTALGLAGEVLHREGEAFALRVRGTAWLDLGDDERASQDIERSLALAGDRNAGGDEVATRTLAGRLALIRQDYHRALGHLRTAIKSARHSDPEEYGPAARALLARCWGRVGEGARCEEQLNHLEGRVGRLPLGRRLPVQLDMAVALGELGRKDEALNLAIEVGQTAHSRGFRLHAMHARLLVAGLGGGEAAEDARREAAELAQAMEAGLADDARPAWQKVAAGAW